METDRSSLRGTAAAVRFAGQLRPGRRLPPAVETVGVYAEAAARSTPRIRNLPGRGAPKQLRPSRNGSRASEEGHTSGTPRSAAPSGTFCGVRVRFHIIRNARIENVGKSQSCMVSKLRIIWKQTV